MTDFEERLKNYIDTEEIFQAGDRLLLAVSGGADSVALLRALSSISEKWNADYQIEVCHIEHGIRGQESVEDAEFVENLCRDLGVVCKTYSVDALGYAKERGLSVEEGARILRYQKFRELATENQQKIVVAHHGCDNVETMLFQLSRGSGLRGFVGMPPVKGRICRPLLFATRDDIVQYLAELQQDYRTDSTNQELTYARNKIRHQVLPVLEEVNPEAISHMMRSMDLLRPLLKEHYRFVQKELQQAMNPKGELLCNRVQAMEKSMQGEVVHEWVRKHSTHAKDIGQVHIDALVSLLSKEVGKSISLPYASVVRGYETLRYLPEDSMEQSCETRRGPLTVSTEDEIPQYRFEEAVTFPALEMGQRMELSFDGYQVKLELVERNPEESPKIKEMTYTKCFDYDKIQDIIQFRNRCTGDRIAVMKHGSKKLKDYLIDAKIPREWRDHLILLSDGQNIMWIVGDRMSEKYKVDNHTKRIIKIEIWRNS